MRNYPDIAMRDIIALYKPAEGRHWFDQNTIKFFNKTVLPARGIATPFGNFFITQETNWSDERRFSVRVQDLSTGNVDTAGDFHTHINRAAANYWLRNHLKQLEAACDSTT